MRPRPLSAGVLLAASIAGCGVVPIGAPIDGRPTPAPLTGDATVAPAAPSPTAPPIATPAASWTILYEVAKYEVGAGGHGGPPLLAFPGTFVADYTVTGTCTFTMAMTAPVGTDATPAHLDVAVAGTTRSGSWTVTIPPGEYYPTVGPEAGCTFHVVMHTVP